MEHGQLLHRAGKALGLVLGIEGGTHHDHRRDVPIFDHVVQHGNDIALGRVEEVPRRHGPAVHQIEDVIPGILIGFVIVVGQIDIGGFLDGGLGRVRIVSTVVGDLHHLPVVAGGGKILLRHRADVLGLFLGCGLFPLHIPRRLCRLGGLLRLGPVRTGPAAAGRQAKHRQNK